MSVHNRNDESSIFVEYCRSCDTHNWCTHHDEAKYHETFLKRKTRIIQSTKWSQDECRNSKSSAIWCPHISYRSKLHRINMSMRIPINTSYTRRSDHSRSPLGEGSSSQRKKATPGLIFHLSSRKYQASLIQTINPLPNSPNRNRKIVRQVRS